MSLGSELSFALRSLPVVCRKAQKHNTENKNAVQHGPHHKFGVNPGAHEGQAVPASYKTAAMLLI
jgi:hypothetical protein